MEPGASRTLRLAMLHYTAPPIVGGVESTIYHHARLLAEAGCRVLVVSGRGESFHPMVSFRTVPEMDSRHPEVLEAGKELAKGEVTERFTGLRDRLIESLRPLLSGVDVCIVHNVTTLHKNIALTAALKWMSDERVARFLSWSHDFAWRDPLYTGDLHHGYPWNVLRSPWSGVRYVAVSAHRRKTMADLLGIPESEIRVIHPGVEISQFLKLAPLTWDLAETLGLLGADPLMLLPSRITRRKNIEFAVRVTAELQRHKPDATLVVTGPPGPHNPANVRYLKELKELCARLGVSERVCFLHEQGEGGAPLHLSDEVVADFYQLADLLLFPSFREGFGIPVLEAGLARVPIFAADIPPLRESAGDLAHFFDPHGDPGQAAVSIAGFLEGDPRYRLRRRVLEQFTWSAVVKCHVLPLLQEVSAHE
ncbi:MAG: glycosyltransferase [Deltaproteobacteria bacterium]|nr:glycosyltransferase [Deltaproteobacteria bacterium]